MKNLLKDEACNFIKADDKDFIIAFDDEMDRLEYTCNKNIGDGYCWGRKMIIYQRLPRNGLAITFSEPLECIRSLAGIQSQFQQYADVSIMNRCDGSLTMNDLAELYQTHEIINLWGQGRKSRRWSLQLTFTISFIVMCL